MRIAEVFIGTPVERAAREQAKELKAKDVLKARERKQLNVASGFSRRLFLRQVGLLGAGVALTGLGVTDFLREKTDNELSIKIPSWITVENREGIGHDRVRDAVKAAIDWDRRYAAGRKITIKPLPFKEKIVEPDGSITTIEEQADSGNIMLGKTGDARNITLHAMTHAAQLDEPFMLDTPLPFSQGVIRGFQGLKVLVTLSSGEETKFTKIEEGMAERNASIFQGYTVNNSRYLAVGNLSRAQLPFDKFPQAHGWAKSNDFPALVRAVLGLPNDSVVNAVQIEKVIMQYNDAWNNAR